MFKGLGNLAQMFKQAQEMSGKISGLNEKLKAKKIVGDAGGGMVRVEANGLSEVTKVEIDQALFDSGEREMTSGINVPGLEDALGKLTGEPKDLDE